MFQPSRYHPVGQGYPNWFRENVVETSQHMTIRATAELYRCSASSVTRFNRLLAETGSINRRPASGGQPRKLLAEEVMVLLWATINEPTFAESS
jgi:transposase